MVWNEARVSEGLSVFDFPDFRSEMGLDPLRKYWLPNFLFGHGQTIQLLQIEPQQKVKPLLWSPT
jgi:hypothetical protein